MRKKITLISNALILLMLLSIFGLTFNFNSQYVFGTAEEIAIYNGNRNSNKVSLMINVYWGNEFIEPMLEVLKQNEVKTTFFVGGMWAEKYEDLMNKIINDGHEIGNHGYFHKNHKKLNYDQNYEEIYMCHKIVKELYNINMNLFAPPSGEYSKTTLKVANELGYKTIMWSKDTIDWRDKDEDIIYNRATKNVKGGDLILMHPTQATLNALDKILKFYKNNNLIATTVSETLK